MTRAEALVALSIPTADNREAMPTRYVQMGGRLVEYVAPVIFDSPEEVKRLADAAGVKVSVLSVDLSRHEVRRWEYEPERTEA